MARTYQVSGVAGEVDDALLGRIDLDRYSNGFRYLLNWLVEEQGSISNVPGTYFVNPVKDVSEQPVLIPFQFSITQAYMLEFGDQYMRVIKDGGHVLETAKTITGATQADPCVITTGTHGYSTGDQVYISGIAGMTKLNGRSYTVTVLSSTTFSLQDWVTGADIDSSSFDAYTSGGEASRIYTLTTPWALADLELIRWTQTADVLTACHPSYAPRSITRTDHDAWTVSTVTFAPATSAPTALTASAGGAASNVYKYAVTAIDADTGEESLTALSTSSLTITAATQANPVVITAGTHNLDTGDEVYIDSIAGMTELNGRRFTIDYVSSTTFSLRGEDGTGHTAYSSGGSATPTFFRLASAAAPTTSAPHAISWTGVTNAIQYSVYKANSGDFFGFIGTSENLTFDDTNIDPDVSDGPPRQKNPFDETGDYPAVPWIFEQRQSYGNTNNEVGAFWMSSSGHYNNMAESRPLRDDDPLKFTLASSQVNAIRGAVNIKGDLLLFTEGAEWAMITGEQPISASNPPKATEQSYYGSANLYPLKVGKDVLWVDRTGSRIRSLRYDFGEDGYAGLDLTAASRHLLRSYSVSRWCYQQSPDSRVWIVRSDGLVLAMTYRREHNVVGISRCVFGDAVESIGAIPDGMEDTVYMVVKRTINGTTVRYIERLASRYFDNDVRDAYFVDCGATVDAPVTITGVTSADPVVVTTSGAHGFSNGDEVEIADIIAVAAAEGETDLSTELNDIRFLVADKTATTFELTDLDGNDIDGAAFSAYSSGGVVRKCNQSLGTDDAGYWWLPGETVVALADGAVDRPLTISAAGEVMLTNKAARVHLGFYENADVRTLPPGAIQVQGKKVKANLVTVKVHETVSLQAGADADSLYDKQRDDPDPDQPLAPETDAWEISVDIGWDHYASAYFRQPDPLPARISAVELDLDASDD